MLQESPILCTNTSDHLSRAAYDAKQHLFPFD